MKLYEKKNIAIKFINKLSSIILSCLILICFLVGCSETITEKVKLTITPYDIQLFSNQQEQFLATISPKNNENKKFVWEIADPLNTGSAISESGLFNAGTSEGTVLVKATWVDDLNICGFAYVVVKKNNDLPPVDPNVLLFDDFKDSSLNNNIWKNMEGIRDYEYNGPYYWGNEELQYYTSDNAIVSDGTLKLYAKREERGDRRWTSSRLITRGNFSFKYGRVEARIKLPDKVGFWPAFWMLPETNTPYGNWPHSGEIDIMEAKGRKTDRVSSAVHYNDNGHTYDTKEYFYTDGTTIADFHTYAVEWRPDRLDFYVDDKLYFSKTDWKPYPAPFDTDFYLIINLAVGGTFDNYREPQSGVNLAVMEIDYVKVTKLTD